MSRIADFTKSKVRSLLGLTSLVQNLGYSSLAGQKRALLAYTAQGLRYNLDDGRTLSHTNLQESLVLLGLLLKRGYAVDVVDANDPLAETTIQEKRYNLVLGLGKLYLTACGANPDALKVLYLTENPPQFALSAEEDRIQYFEVRHGKMPSRLRRSGGFFDVHHFEVSDKIIYMGEPSLIALFGKPSYRIYPTGFGREGYAPEKSDVEARKTNFLWFGSGNGLVHKGLDLVVDVFRDHPEWRLQVCGASRGMLPNSRSVPGNIEFHGWVDVGSSRFLDLIQTTCFAVFPSCSEALSTGVLTLLRHGIIPIVMHNLGFDDFPELVRFFPGFQLADIEQGVHDALTMDVPEIQAQMERNVQVSSDIFCLDHFERRLEEILDEAL
jgi:hypothetical protein